jgi:hypothetical protein
MTLPMFARLARHLLAVAMLGGLLLPAGAAAAGFPARADVERSATTGAVRFVGSPARRPLPRPAGFTAASEPGAVGRAYLRENAGAFEVRRQVFVDAHTGVVVLTLDETHEARNRSVCDASNVATPAPTAMVPRVRCTAPTLVEGGSTAGRNADIVNAYDYAGATYDLYSTLFGRDSLDGAGMQIKSTVKWATFRWAATGNVGTARYQCKLDAGRWKACRSPLTIQRLEPGRHTFRVRALDSRNKPSAAVKKSFSVRRRR